ncbi:MAG: Dabb family protein [Bacteroidota bacterium]
MKKILLSLLASIVCVAMMTPQANAQSKTSPKTLRHVVLFKFKDSSSVQEIKVVEDAFSSLAGKINLIKNFEWGTNNSPENLNQGLTHCFLVSFASEKDRDDYLVHQDHVAFVDVLKPHLDKATVIDYWVK